MKRRGRALPYDDWPDADRNAWQTLLRVGDVLDGRGAGAHWAAGTRRTNLKHYSRWLGWLAARGSFVSGEVPEDRVTPENVWAYARELLDSVAPKTVASYLRDLKVVIKAMAPERDWRWLMDLTNRLKRSAKPSRDRSSQILRADDVFDGSWPSWISSLEAALPHAGSSWPIGTL